MLRFNWNIQFTFTWKASLRDILIASRTKKVIIFNILELHEIFVVKLIDLAN